MSVDYVIHLAHAYNFSLLTTRRARARSALLARGGSVLSAASSTIGCVSMLLLCQIQLFPQFASIVITAIGYSVLCALVGFPARVPAASRRGQLARAAVSL